MRSRLGVTAVLLLAALAAPPASAQDVTYKTRSSISMGGAMDALMGMAARMGGGSTETVETQYIKPGKMRTDVMESSSIVDLEGRRYISVDHNNRTYTVVSFDSVTAMAQSMSQQMNQAGQAPRQPTSPPTDQPQMEYSFDVSVDRAGERQSIAGYQAERVFVTVEMEGREAGTQDQDGQGGRIVMLTDMWVSPDAPGYEAFASNQSDQAQAMAGATRDMSSAMGAMFAQNPNQRAAMERAAEEMKKVEGMPLKTTTHMVMVPLDQEFDRDAALAPPAPKQEGSGVSAGDVARSALGGLFGRGRQPEPEPEPAADGPTQLTVMRVEQEVIEISTAAIPDSTFEVPQGYTLAQ